MLLVVLTTVGMTMMIGTAVADVRLADTADAVVTLDLASANPAARQVTVEWSTGGASCPIGEVGSFTLEVAAVSGSVVGATPSVTHGHLVFDDPSDCAGQSFTVSGTSVGSATFSAVVTSVECFTQCSDGEWQRLVSSLVSATPLFTTTVTVLDSSVTGALDASEIANGYLKDRGANADCRAAWGTNKTKSNWHGQLISHIAQHFAGQTVSQAQVEAYVESACAS